MGRTKARDLDDKQIVILNSADQVFAKDGFDSASMNQVAAACGISKASINNHYSGKDELLFDLLDRYLCDVRDVVL